jgi:Mg-chelatase subunit ChlD
VSLTEDILQIKGVQSIVSVVALSNTPVSIAVVNDTSNSREGEYSVQTRFIKLVLRSTFRQSFDRGLFVNFYSASEFVQGWTEDLPEMLRATGEGKPGGGSAIYDSLMITSRKIVEATPPSQPRVILLFTDGRDNKSLVSIDEALAELLRANVRVYAFTVEHSLVADVGTGILGYLTRKTGGRVIQFTENTSEHELNGELKSLTAELRSWYALSFVPLPNTGKKVKAQKFSIKTSMPKVDIQAAEQYYLAPSR